MAGLVYTDGRACSLFMTQAGYLSCFKCPGSASPQLNTRNTSASARSPLGPSRGEQNLNNSLKMPGIIPSHTMIK